MSEPVPQGARTNRRTRLYGVAQTTDGVENGHLPPGTHAGDYVIEGHLADGGMASVYFATHPLIGKRAAVKVLSSALAQNEVAIGRFLREARAVNQIRHQNIVDIFAFGQLTDGRHYLVMEKLEGETLLDRMERAPLLLHETVDILVQIAEALEAAHAHQIAHLDLKPENVFLVPGRGGRPLAKLLDFGIAKLLSTDARETVNEFCGTPDYASPEQARGLASIDHRSDVYSLGVVAYELLVGRRPFEADSPLGILFKHIGEDPPRPSTLQNALLPELELLLLEMLSKAPENRPSMNDVANRLLTACPPVQTFSSSGQLRIIHDEPSMPIALEAPSIPNYVVRGPLAKWGMAATGAFFVIGSYLVFRPAPKKVIAPVAPPVVVAAATPAAPPAVVPAPPAAPVVAKPIAHKRHVGRLVVPASVRAPGADYVLDYSGKPK